MTDAHTYDVALSFAGEDRSHAEELSRLLKKYGVRVFYDLAEQASLWGKDLYQHLAPVYGEQSRYCVIFVSAKYLEKLWTKHELRQAQARSFTLDREYILPLRLDDTVLPGLPMTVGYVDLRTTKPSQIALMLLDKLGIDANGLADEVERASWNGELVTYIRSRRWKPCIRFASRVNQNKRASPPPAPCSIVAMESLSSRRK